MRLVGHFLADLRRPRSLLQAAHGAILQMMGGNRNHDLEIVLQRDRDRYAMLYELCKSTSGNVMGYCGDVVAAVQSQGIDRQSAILAYQFLRGEGLIVTRGTGYRAGITHEGVKEIEQSIKHPNQPTEHFVVQVIQHFHGAVGAVQTGPDATANTKQRG